MSSDDTRIAQLIERVETHIPAQLSLEATAVAASYVDPPLQHHTSGKVDRGVSDTPGGVKRVNRDAWSMINNDFVTIYGATAEESYLREFDEDEGDSGTSCSSFESEASEEVDGSPRSGDDEVDDTFRAKAKKALLESTNTQHHKNQAARLLWMLRRNETIKSRIQGCIADYKLKSLNSGEEGGAPAAPLRPTEQDVHDRVTLQCHLKTAATTSPCTTTSATATNVASSHHHNHQVEYDDCLLYRFLSDLWKVDCSRYAATTTIPTTVSPSKGRRSISQSTFIELFNEAHTELSFLVNPKKERGSGTENGGGVMVIPADVDVFLRVDFDALFGVFLLPSSSSGINGVNDTGSARSSIRHPTASVQSLRALVSYFKYKISHSACCQAHIHRRQAPSSSSFSTVPHPSINSSGGGDSADGSSISNGSLWRRLLLGDGNSAGVSNGAGEEDELPTPLSFLETLLNPQYSSSSSSVEENEKDDDDISSSELPHTWVSTFNPLINSFASVPCSSAASSSISSSCVELFHAFQVASAYTYRGGTSSSGSGTVLLLLAATTDRCCCVGGCQISPAGRRPTPSTTTTSTSNSLPRSTTTTASQTTNTTIMGIKMQQGIPEEHRTYTKTLPLQLPLSDRLFFNRRVLTSKTITSTMIMPNGKGGMAGMGSGTAPSPTTYYLSFAFQNLFFGMSCAESREKRCLLACAGGLPLGRVGVNGEMQPGTYGALGMTPVQAIMRAEVQQGSQSVAEVKHGTAISQHPLPFTAEMKRELRFDGSAMRAQLSKIPGARTTTTANSSLRAVGATLSNIVASSSSSQKALNHRHNNNNGTSNLSTSSSSPSNSESDDLDGEMPSSVSAVPHHQVQSSSIPPRQLDDKYDTNTLISESVGGTDDHTNYEGLINENPQTGGGAPSLLLAHAALRGSMKQQDPPTTSSTSHAPTVSSLPLVTPSCEGIGCHVLPFIFDSTSDASFQACQSAAIADGFKAPTGVMACQQATARYITSNFQTHQMQAYIDRHVRMYGKYRRLRRSRNVILEKLNVALREEMESQRRRQNSLDMFDSTTAATPTAPTTTTDTPPTHNINNTATATTTLPSTSSSSSSSLLLSTTLTKELSTVDAQMEQLSTYLLTYRLPTDMQRMLLDHSTAPTEAHGVQVLKASRKNLRPQSITNIEIQLKNKTRGNAATHDEDYESTRIVPVEKLSERLRVAYATEYTTAARSVSSTKKFTHIADRNEALLSYVTNTQYMGILLKRADGVTYLSAHPPLLPIVQKYQAAADRYISMPGKSRSHLLAAPCAVAFYESGAASFPIGALSELITDARIPQFHTNDNPKASSSTTKKASSPSPPADHPLRRLKALQREFRMLMRRQKFPILLVGPDCTVAESPHYVPSPSPVVPVGDLGSAKLFHELSNIILVLPATSTVKTGSPKGSSGPSPDLIAPPPLSSSTQDGGGAEESSSSTAAITNTSHQSSLLEFYGSDSLLFLVECHKLFFYTKHLLTRKSIIRRPHCPLLPIQSAKHHDPIAAEVPPTMERTFGLLRLLAGTPQSRTMSPCTMSFAASSEEFTSYFLESRTAIASRNVALSPITDFLVSLPALMEKQFGGGDGGTVPAVSTSSLSANSSVLNAEAKAVLWELLWGQSLYFSTSSYSSSSSSPSKRRDHKSVTRTAAPTATITISEQERLAPKYTFLPQRYLGAVNLLGLVVRQQQQPSSSTSSSPLSPVLSILSDCCEKSTHHRHLHMLHRNPQTRIGSVAAEMIDLPTLAQFKATMEVLRGVLESPIPQGRRRLLTTNATTTTAAAAAAAAATSPDKEEVNEIATRQQQNNSPTDEQPTLQGKRRKKAQQRRDEQAAANNQSSSVSPGGNTNYSNSIAPSSSSLPATQQLPPSSVHRTQDAIPRTRGANHFITGRTFSFLEYYNDNTIEAKREKRDAKKRRRTRIDDGYHNGADGYYRQASMSSSILRRSQQSGSQDLNSSEMFSDDDDYSSDNSGRRIPSSSPSDGSSSSDSADGDDAGRGGGRFLRGGGNTTRKKGPTVVHEDMSLLLRKGAITVSKTAIEINILTEPHLPRASKVMVPNPTTTNNTALGRSSPPLSPTISKRSTLSESGMKAAARALMHLIAVDQRLASKLDFTGMEMMQFDSFLQSLLGISRLKMSSYLLTTGRAKSTSLSPDRPPLSPYATRTISSPTGRMTPTGRTIGGGGGGGAVSRSISNTPLQRRPETPESSSMYQREAAAAGPRSSFYNDSILGGGGGNVNGGGGGVFTESTQKLASYKVGKRIPISLIEEIILGHSTSFAPMLSAAQWHATQASSAGCQFGQYLQHIRSVSADTPSATYSPPPQQPSSSSGGGGGGLRGGIMGVGGVGGSVPLKQMKFVGLSYERDDNGALLPAIETTEGLFARFYQSLTIVFVNSSLAVASEIDLELDGIDGVARNRNNSNVPSPLDLGTRIREGVSIICDTKAEWNALITSLSTVQGVSFSPAAVSMGLERCIPMRFDQPLPICAMMRMAGVPEETIQREVQLVEFWDDDSSSSSRSGSSSDDDSDGSSSSTFGSEDDDDSTSSGGDDERRRPATTSTRRPASSNFLGRLPPTAAAASHQRGTRRSNTTRSRSSPAPPTGHGSSSSPLSQLPIVVAYRTLKDEEEISLCEQFHIDPVSYVALKRRVLSPQCSDVKVFDDLADVCDLDTFRISVILQYFQCKGWVRMHTLFKSVPATTGLSHL